MVDFSDWLLPEPRPSTTAASWRLTRSDECDDVAVFDDYTTYFKRLAELFEQTKEGDQIFLVGWVFKLDQELVSGKTLESLMRRAVAAKVRVRLLVTGKNHYASLRLQNDEEWEKAEKICAKGDARIDEQSNASDSHHQKAVFVSVTGKDKKRTSHLFVGGMDVADGGRLGGWFDGQAEITGHAADLGLMSLEERWASVAGVAFSPAFTKGKGGGTTFVQYVRTYSKASPQAISDGRKYALSGDFSYSELLVHAIGKTQNFIYLEDQSFMSHAHSPTADVDAALVKAVSNGVRLIVVATRPNELESSHVTLRDALLRKLRAGVRKSDQLRLYALNERLKWKPSYVHTKVWIMDDKLAVVGSGNYWMPSMQKESEMAVGIASTLSKPDFPGVPFAHALRIQMWNRLLKAAGKNPIKKDKDAKFLDELGVLVGKDTPLQPL